MAKQFHHYVVTGTMPRSPEKSWRHTVRWGVIASTPELAGMQSRLCHPDVIISSITHRGAIDFFHEVCQYAGCNDTGDDADGESDKIST